MAAIFHVDGSQGEGGGQIIRNAISYANILRKPIQISNIRAKRSKPGLKAQHVASLQLPTKIAGGRLTGDQLHSTEITFHPLTVNSADDRIVEGKIDTAGSICLLLQAGLPCALFGQNSVELKLQGGTNATMAPQYDYWTHVFLPVLLDQFQLQPDQVQGTVDVRGYFPRGGGKVRVRVKPLTRPLPAIQMTDCGVVNQISIRSFHAGKLPRSLAETMTNSAINFLKQRIGDSVPIQTEIVFESNAVGNGSGILIVAKTTTGCILGGSAIGSPKDQDAGEQAAQEVWAAMASGGCVDEWLQDQLILYMALAEGQSQLLTGSLTLHTRTAIWLAAELSGAEFNVTRLDDEQEQGDDSSTGYGMKDKIAGRHLIECKGIGFYNAAN